MNPNPAEYLVPVNADVPSLEAILVAEHDPHVNALGIKGLGEIGMARRAPSPTPCAHAMRIRRFPITLHQLIDAGIGPALRWAGDVAQPSIGLMLTAQHLLCQPVLRPPLRAGANRPRPAG